MKEIPLDDFGKLVFKHKINPNLFAERTYYWVDRIIVLDETGGRRRIIESTQYSIFNLSGWEPMTREEYDSVKKYYKEAVQK